VSVAGILLVIGLAWWWLAASDNPSVPALSELAAPLMFGLLGYASIGYTALSIVGGELSTTSDGGDPKTKIARTLAMLPKQRLQAMAIASGLFGAGGIALLASGAHPLAVVPSAVLLIAMQTVAAGAFLNAVPSLAHKSVLERAFKAAGTPGPIGRVVLAQLGELVVQLAAQGDERQAVEVINRMFDAIRATHQRYGRTPSRQRTSDVLVPRRKLAETGTVAENLENAWRRGVKGFLVDRLREVDEHKRDEFPVDDPLVMGFLNGSAKGTGVCDPVVAGWVASVFTTDAIAMTAETVMASTKFKAAVPVQPQH
jgi:hypothetical protein